MGMVSGYDMYVGVPARVSSMLLVLWGSTGCWCLGPWMLRHLCMGLGGGISYWSQGVGEVLPLLLVVEVRLGSL